MDDVLLGEYECVPLRGGIPGHKYGVVLLVIKLQVFRSPDNFAHYVAVIKGGDGTDNGVLATVPFPTIAEKEVVGISPNGAVCPVKFEAYSNKKELDLYVTLQDGTAEYRLQTVDMLEHDLPGLIVEGVWQIFPPVCKIDEKKEQ